MVKWYVNVKNKQKIVLTEDLQVCLCTCTLCKIRMSSAVLSDYPFSV